MAPSERQAGASQQADPDEGPGNTDTPGKTGPPDQDGEAGDNQSGPEEVASSSGDPSLRLPLGVVDAAEDLGPGPAGSAGDVAPNPVAPSSGSRLPAVGSAGGGAALLVSATAGPPSQAEALWLSHPVPPWVDGAGPPVPGGDVGPSPAGVGVALPGRDAPPGEAGAAPGSSPQDRPVSWLAGELRGTLAVDTAVLEHGLQRFLDQLNALALPAPEPGGPSWLARVPALLPWLGAAAAATAALELARRRLRPPPESAFPSSADGGRWPGTGGLPGPLREEEP